MHFPLKIAALPIPGIYKLYYHLHFLSWQWLHFQHMEMTVRVYVAIWWSAVCRLCWNVNNVNLENVGEISPFLRGYKIMQASMFSNVMLQGHKVSVTTCLWFWILDIKMCNLPWLESEFESLFRPWAHHSLKTQITVAMTDHFFKLCCSNSFAFVY